MPLSWVTVIWSMIASACLMLAVMYFLVWFRNRREWAHFLFSLNAVSMAAFAACELWMMRAATPDELNTALRWAHVPLFSWLLSTTWFVGVYLQAGRWWLAWSILIVRALMLIINFQPGQNLTFRAMLPLEQIRFLGESVTVAAGIPNPWQLVTQTTVILILVFVADASVTAWRRGDRRKAVIVGGSVEFILIAAFVTGAPVTWGMVRAPYVFSLPYMCLVLVMGYELSRNVLRASQLVRELSATEAGLRENQARLQASHQQISDLFGRLIAAQETERTRIAHDLHDGVGQRIAGLSIAMSNLKRKLDGGREEIFAALTWMQRETATLADDIRNVSHELYPTTLHHAGLVPALRAACSQFQQRQGIVVAFRNDADLGPLHTTAELGLYRVAQELLHNVAKHADAHRVEVTLTRMAGGVQLTVADDGKGFNVSDTRGRPGGLGLVSIDERIRSMRGQVDIRAAPGRGTRVEVQIPVHPAA
jgi:signal transduction histidine kinase